MVLFTNGFLVFAAAWLSALTFFVFRLARHYRRLTAGVTKTGLITILEKILSGQQEIQKKLKDTDAVLAKLAQEGMTHIRHIGVIRFNPFRDTGGSQSFTVALLDDSGDGIVMTSLYARSGNRWYIKEVRAGKGATMALSSEEEAAVKDARRTAYAR